MCPDTMHRPQNHRILARVKLRRGAPANSVVEMLREAGCENEQSQRLVREELAALHSKDGCLIGGGLLISMIGLIASAVSYAEASRQPFGGMYLVFWAPILLGAVMLITGFVRTCRHNG